MVIVVRTGLRREHEHRITMTYVKETYHPNSVEASLMDRLFKQMAGAAFHSGR